ncbi:hypothetical protein OG562_12985 [Streptomyces sp. NBC_01275]|uniref:hypothetical protein n=1 Tax=Streptomyces sp. NBC_01275 TaxID=2903807 RepID=UPI002255442D|nr:hypothetical protein [Streptomyces sp. NBC_01275]MCX4761871.1 hypothetical protein [Streptomyces sp. NBC_01275]
MLITDAAVREAAANLAQNLGGDWAIDAEAPADGAAHLIYSDGRGISFRPIFGGTTVQLWITGNATPAFPEGATVAEQATCEAQFALRLPEGHRYNKSTTLVTETDEDPELIILRTLEDDLLPAFDYKPRYVGHRPWIDLFDSALSQVMGEAPPATGTSLRDSGPEAHTTPHDVGREAEPAIDTETGPAADSDLAIEHDPTPVPGSDQQPESPAVDEAQEGGPAPAEELEPAVTRPPSVEPEPDSAPEASPADENSGEADDQPTDETSPSTKRRPRTRKRRPKASST